jgi:hypothetical protein
MFQVRRNQNNWCAPHSRIFLQNLIVIHLVRNLSYFKKSNNTSPSTKMPAKVHYPELAQLSSRGSSWIFISMLPSHTHAGFHSGHFSSSSQTKFLLMSFSSVRDILICHAPLVLLNLTTLTILYQMHKLRSSCFIQFWLVFCYFVSLDSKHLPRLDIPRHPQIYVLPLGRKLKLFTHIKHEWVLHDTCFFLTVKDSSGLRIHYTKDLRQYDGGILVNGITITPLHIVPPHQPEYRTAGYCNSLCTHKVRINFTVSLQDKLSTTYRISETAVSNSTLTLLISQYNSCTIIHCECFKSKYFTCPCFETHELIC